jgi:hypothetical protein
MLWSYLRSKIVSSVIYARDVLSLALVAYYIRCQVSDFFFKETFKPITINLTKLLYLDKLVLFKMLIKFEILKYLSCLIFCFLSFMFKFHLLA